MYDYTGVINQLCVIIGNLTHCVFQEAAPDYDRFNTIKEKERKQWLADLGYSDLYIFPF